MDRRMLVTLVGKQTMPTVIATAHHQPDVVVAIHSPDTRLQANSLRAALQMLDSKVQYEQFQVDALCLFGKLALW
jgi:hypothetical protein